MTKTEEALCNGITFSVLRLVPSAIQEGEIEGAIYYVYALITPSYDKLVLKIWNAPDYIPMKIREENVESITFDLDRDEVEEGQTVFYSYNFGHSGDGHGKYYLEGDSYERLIDGNVGKAYNGLLLYPGIKCVIIETIKSIIRKNNE